MANMTERKVLADLLNEGLIHPDARVLVDRIGKMVRKNEETGRWEAVPKEQYSHRDVVRAIEDACDAEVLTDMYDDNGHFYKMCLGDGQTVHITINEPDEDEEGEAE